MIQKDYIKKRHFWKMDRGELIALIIKLDSEEEE